MTIYSRWFIITHSRTVHHKDPFTNALFCFSPHISIHTHTNTHIRHRISFIHWYRTVTIVTAYLTTEPQRIPINTYTLTYLSCYVQWVYVNGIGEAHTFTILFSVYVEHSYRSVDYIFRCFLVLMWNIYKTKKKINNNNRESDKKTFHALVMTCNNCAIEI